MKLNLPNVRRLTLREKIVIEWAFNFAHSIVTGDYNLPGPMCYAMKNLHNAVFQLAQERGTSIADGCTEEYLGFNRGYWDGVKKKMKGRKKESR